MLCPRCHGKQLLDGRPCPECGGFGVVHCCEGLTEQPGPTVDECRDRLHRGEGDARNGWGPA
jgi:DnaJ-class molecular chaperone